MSNGLINRQYVGARYVPKIMGEWNKALQYEALSVVTYMGNSFTSKVPVPANSVDINNTDYWVNTGNYNAQVESYRTETNNVKNGLEEETNNRINEDNIINANFNARNTLKDRFFIFMGDSYSIGTSGGQNVTDFGWCDQVIKMLDIKADHYYHCSFDDLTCGTQTVSIPAFYPSAGTHKSFRDILAYAVTKHIPNDFIKKVTDIVCCGGYNEINTNEAGINQGMDDFIIYCKNTFPNAKIWTGEIGMDVNPTSYSIREKFFDYIIPTYNSASNKGFCVMNNVMVLRNSTQCPSDYIHPNKETYTEIALRIANNLLGISGNNNEKNKFTTTGLLNGKNNFSLTVVQLPIGKGTLISTTSLIEDTWENIKGGITFQGMNTENLLMTITDNIKYTLPCYGGTDISHLGFAVIEIKQNQEVNITVLTEKQDYNDSDILTLHIIDNGYMYIPYPYLL